MGDDQRMPAGQQPGRPGCSNPGAAGRPVRVRLVLGWAASLGLAAVFLAAAVPKILWPQQFADVVFRYQIAPESLVHALAIFLPWLELCLAIAVVLPAFRRAALTLMLALLVVFVALEAATWWRGLDVACGCFSLDPRAGRVGAWTIARDVGLMAGAWLSWWGSATSRRSGAEPHPAAPGA